MKHLELMHYLSTNRIVDIGDEMQDIIVRNWKEFLVFAYSCGYYVSYILWWEHLSIANRNKEFATLGGGGPIDKINEGYFYGETMIEEEFCEGTALSSITEYIEKTIALYKPHVLVPSFTIECRGRFEPKNTV